MLPTTSDAKSLQVNLLTYVMCCPYQLQGVVERVPSFPTEVDPVMEKKYKDNFYAAVSLLA